MKRVVLFSKKALVVCSPDVIILLVLRDGSGDGATGSILANMEGHLSILLYGKDGLVDGDDDSAPLVVAEATLALIAEAVMGSFVDPDRVVTTINIDGLAAKAALGLR